MKSTQKFKIKINFVLNILCIGLDLYVQVNQHDSTSYISEETVLNFGFCPVRTPSFNKLIYYIRTKHIANNVYMINLQLPAR